MITIVYPEPHFKIKEENGKPYLFDPIRKIWVLLTEEEWVRQNFISYMVQQLHYPSTLIALEKELTLNDLKKRFDILIYNKQHQPWMLIECKAPHIPLRNEVLEQAMRYNISVPATYIVLTNGNATIGWKKENNALQLLQEMPAWID